MSQQEAPVEELRTQLEALMLASPHGFVTWPLMPEQAKALLAVLHAHPAPVGHVEPLVSPLCAAVLDGDDPQAAARRIDSFASGIAGLLKYQGSAGEAWLRKIAALLRERAAAGPVVGYVSQYTIDTLQEARARGHGTVKQIVSQPARSVTIPLYAAPPSTGGESEQ